ncbi:MAG: acyl-ACP--UDP-N-acetylglucosamine O-acyltransferase [Opitutaceae bacterium]|nr:acyl-ACP--UDP-N-acetylglucosamine O-acyltransferase [Opitutaceae bacterium]
MATQIHPLAFVEPGAELGTDVVVGAFAFIGTGARIGDRTRLHHHACVEGNTHVGADCELFAFTSIGAKTQDLKFKGGNPGTRIGDRNIFREYVSVHAATNDGEFTTVGNDNVILAHGHIAHDCKVGNHVIASNNTGLAGHVEVEDHVTFGALAGVHQFCRIGAYSMVSAYAKVVQDVSPFFIADGQPAVIRAINKVGLERKGFSAEQLERIKQLYRVLFREGLNRTQAFEKLEQMEGSGSEEFQRVLKFAARSERGLAPGG